MLEGGCTRRYEGLTHQANKVVTTAQCNIYTHLQDTVFKTGQQTVLKSVLPQQKMCENKWNGAFKFNKLNLAY